MIHDAMKVNIMTLTRAFLHGMVCVMETYAKDEDEGYKVLLCSMHQDDTGSWVITPFAEMIPDGINPTDWYTPINPKELLALDGTLLPITNLRPDVPSEGDERIIRHAFPRYDEEKETDDED